METIDAEQVAARAVGTAAMPPLEDAPGKLRPCQRVAQAGVVRYKPISRAGIRNQLRGKR